MMLASRLTQACSRNATHLRRGLMSQKRNMSSFLDEYDAHVAERAAMADGIGIAPKPLDASQTNQVIDELKASGSNDKLLELLV